MCGEPEVDISEHGPEVIRVVPLFGGEDAEFCGWLDDVGSFVGNAVKTAGKEIGKVGHGIQKAGGAVGSAIGKVPVIGAPVKVVLDAGYHAMRAPIDMTVQIASGKRVDKVLMGKLKEHVQDVKNVAPYAQTVVSMVPGVGTGAAAALGTGLSLASGQPIDEALKAGVIGAIPGGPVAQAAANMTITVCGNAARGQKVDFKKLAVEGASALPISGDAKRALAAGIEMTVDAATGKKVDIAKAEALLNLGMKEMGVDAKKALQTGLGVGVAEIQQKARGIAIPKAVGKFAESGVQVAKKVPAIGEARKLAGKGLKGFDVGQGIMNQRARLFDIAATRASLVKPEDKKGFDMALATRIGLVTHAAKPNLSTAALAGRAITNGMQGMRNANHKMAIMSNVSKSPSAAVGAEYAIQKIVAKRNAAKETWPVRMVRAIRNVFKRAA